MGFPQEIWDDITGYLSAKSAYNTSAILRIPVSESNKKSAAVWEAIFRDESWVYRLKYSPVLLGSDLRALYADNSLNRPAYVVLTVRPGKGSIGIDATEFLRSLQPHILVDGIIHFTNSYIKLSAPEIISDGADWITLSNPEKLFHLDKRGRVASYCLFWDNTIRHQCRELGGDDILGENGKISTLQNLANICWVFLPGKTSVLIANSHLSHLEHKRLLTELVTTNMHVLGVLRR